MSAGDPELTVQQLEAAGVKRLSVVHALAARCASQLVGATQLDIFAPRMLGCGRRFALALAILLLAWHNAQAQSAAQAAPLHIRKAGELIDDVVPQYSTIVQARKRLEERGLFCTWGGAQLVESVRARFLLCGLSCAQSSADGWWAYLSEVVGRGVQFIEIGQAGASIIKPYLPADCPQPTAATAPPPTR